LRQRFIGAMTIAVIRSFGGRAQRSRCPVRRPVRRRPDPGSLLGRALDSYDADGHQNRDIAALAGIRSYSRRSATFGSSVVFGRAAGMRARRDTTWSNRAVTFIDPQRTRSLPTAELTAHETGAIRELLWAAFEADEDGFSEDDWQHALGGRHVVVEDGGRIVSHAAVVERAIEIGGERLRAGCVEAVATVPEEQARGHGTRAMTAVGELIRTGFEIGVLGTGSHGFYERLGWTTWRGPSFVRTAHGLVSTPDDDGYLMVLRTASTPTLDPEAPIVCEWRPGDVW